MCNIHPTRLRHPTQQAKPGSFEPKTPTQKGTPGKAISHFPVGENSQFRPSPDRKKPATMLPGSGQAERKRMTNQAQAMKTEYVPPRQGGPKTNTSEPTSKHKKITDQGKPRKEEGLPRHQERPMNRPRLRLVTNFSG
jgi:hypothetical protein